MGRGWRPADQTELQFAANGNPEDDPLRDHTTHIQITDNFLCTPDFPKFYKLESSMNYQLVLQFHEHYLLVLLMKSSSSCSSSSPFPSSSSSSSSSPGSAFPSDASALVRMTWGSRSFADVS